MGARPVRRAGPEAGEGAPEPGAPFGRGSTGRRFGSLTGTVLRCGAWKRAGRVLVQAGGPPVAVECSHTGATGPDVHWLLVLPHPDPGAPAEAALVVECTPGEARHVLRARLTVADALRYLDLTPHGTPLDGG